ncbi:MAG: hypothetical protein KDA91_03065 [Planctomycetaceae bacterium]|nr:hypothetical protein [Planctomycetaceae bacterium]
MTWTEREVIAWLDEQLPAARMAEFEQQLRVDEALRSRVSVCIRHRDQGGRSVGEIWQRGRLSCPTRTELGGYLLGALSVESSEYIDFHLKTVGCRLCDANLVDLEEQSTSDSGTPGRRKRFFESSAGLLREKLDSEEQSAF